MGTSYDPIRKPFFKSNLFTIICLLLALISTTASGFFAGILYGERHKRHGQSTHVSDHYPHDIVKCETNSAVVESRSH